MDFIEKLPLYGGFDTTLAAVHRLTQFGHFIPLTYRFSTLQVAQTFLDNIYKVHGLPEFIITDRDKPMFPWITRIYHY